MKQIFMSINDFVVIDGEALPKRSDFFGGHYLYSELPEGKLRVESSDVTDQIEIYRSGNKKVRFATRDELYQESEEDFW